jgi:hypothetical protein
VVLIDTKAEQLSAIVNTYRPRRRCGTISTPQTSRSIPVHPHDPQRRELLDDLRCSTRSGRYCKAPGGQQECRPRLRPPDRRGKIIIPRVNQLDPALIEEVPAPAPPVPEMVPGDEPAILPLAPPPPAGTPGPFGQEGTEDPAVKATGGTKPPTASPKPATTGK